MMRARRDTAVARRLTLACGLVMSLCGVAAGQDSVATLPGLPGDALDAYATSPSTQQVNYVVDLATRTSSWGGGFVLGPVVKASKSNAGGYFDLLVGAQTVSNRLLPSQAFAVSGPYARWTTAGEGVNSAANATPAESISGAGRFGPRLAIGFHEFGSGVDGAFGSGDDENNVVGALINFQTRDPSRVYVSRRYAAHNKATAAAQGTASFGVGGIDEQGAVHYLADNYGMTTPLRLSQRELQRVQLALRSTGGLNTISQGGPTDPAATTRVRISPTSMTVPNILPQSVVGGAGRPVLVGSDFASNLIAETAAGTTTTAAFPGGSPRGSVSVSPQVFAPLAGGGAVATAASLVRTDTNTKTRGVQIFGLTSAGASTGVTQQIVLPAVDTAIVDPTDGFSPGAAFAPLGNHEFTNYASQASFRGGTSQVAMTVLPGGDLVIAAAVAATGGGSTVPQSENNYLAVARVPSTGGAATWTIAAHTGGAAAGGGKAILGRNLAGQLAPIGRLVRFTEVFGAASTGPSISSAAMDRVGNLYFMATMSLDTPSGTPNLTSGLVRANFNASTNAYQLELVAALGDVVLGRNSNVNYQIQFIGIADADSVDSGSTFSTSIVQDTLGANLANVPYGSPMSLGALAFRAKIVYDINNDGLYADPSGASGGSTSPDQAYNAVMLLMPRIAVGDFNRDGAKTVQDIFDLLAAYFAGGAGGDYNGDGVAGVQDIFDFLRDWFQA